MEIGITNLIRVTKFDYHGSTAGKKSVYGAPPTRSQRNKKKTGLHACGVLF